MKQQLILGTAIGALVLGSSAGAMTASAETAARPGVWEGKTSQSLGRLVSYRDGRLRLAVGAREKRIDYVIDGGTRCAFARGNRATTMRCSQLAQKRYRSKPVRALWRTGAQKRRIVVTVGVILSPRR